MLQNNRVLFKSNGTLTDFSIPLSDYLSKAETPFGFESGDALYIGSDLPFNHRWFEVAECNDELALVSVKYWNGDEWKSAVDVIDQTSVDGKSLAKSGVISWTPDKYESWFREETTEDIPELSQFKIYDLFWVKITFDADLSSTSSLRYLGHKFSGDVDLFARYAGLANTDLIAAFAEGKINWDDQHFIAAEELIQHLRANRTIISPNQILRFEQYKIPSVHKCAEVIYRSFGDDYENEMKNAAAEFQKAMLTASQNIDRNANATLDFNEKSSTTEFMDR